MPSEPLTVTVRCIDLPEFKALHAAAGKFLEWTLKGDGNGGDALAVVYREMFDAYFAVSGTKPRAYDYPIAG